MGERDCRSTCGSPPPRTGKNTAGEMMIRQQEELDDLGPRIHSPQGREFEESVERELTNLAGQN